MIKMDDRDSNECQNWEKKNKMVINENDLNDTNGQNVQ